MNRYDDGLTMISTPFKRFSCRVVVDDRWLFREGLALSPLASTKFNWILIHLSCTVTDDRCPWDDLLWGYSRMESNFLEFLFGFFPHLSSPGN